MSIGKTSADTIAFANKSVLGAYPIASQDSARPVCHFTAPAQWMNDICAAIYHDGYYHIFYQFNPFDDQCLNWSKVYACWGHARSRDMIHWEHLPIAIAPSEDTDCLQCVSGSAVCRGDGLPVLFYGHTPIPKDGVKPPRQQRCALPLDSELRTWKTQDVGLIPGQSGIPEDIAGGWTDMFVFHDAGKTFAIFKESNGMVMQATDSMLKQWRVVGRIDGVYGECPNFVKLHDKWVMIRSTYPMTYQVGDFDSDQIRFDMNGLSGVLDYAYGLDLQRDPFGDYSSYHISDGVLVCKYGAPEAYSQSRGFYATNLLTTPDDRVIMFGWVGAFESKGWNGCMSLPRELSLDQTGRLRQRPAKEVQKLQGEQYQLEPCLLENEKRLVPNFAGDTLELLLDMKLTDSSCFSLSICHPQKNMSAVLILYDGTCLNINGTLIPRVYAPDPTRLKLHLFYDKSVLELFVNDGRQVVTRVAYPVSEEMVVELGSQGRAMVDLCLVYSLKRASADGMI